MRKRRALVIFSSMVLLYPLSYAVVSRKGCYEARGSWGLAQGPNNTALFAPKRGYDWYAFPDAKSIGEKGVETFYSPMQEVDRSLWHVQLNPWQSEPKYPVKLYVNPKTGETKDFP